MKAFVSCFLFVLLYTSAWAQNGSQTWHWYYASPSFGFPEERTFLRFGTARVHMGDGLIRIDFTERAFPEYSPTFAGQLAGNGNVTGVLQGFFLHEPELRTGHYGQDEAEPGCRYEEIMLRTGFVDGSVLMVSRLTGECRGNPDP